MTFDVFDVTRFPFEKENYLGFEAWYSERKKISQKKKWYKIIHSLKRLTFAEKVFFFHGKLVRGKVSIRIMQNFFYQQNSIPTEPDQEQLYVCVSSAGYLINSIQ